MAGLWRALFCSEDFDALTTQGHGALDRGSVGMQQSLLIQSLRLHGIIGEASALRPSLPQRWTFSDSHRIQWGTGRVNCLVSLESAQIL